MKKRLFFSCCFFAVVVASVITKHYQLTLSDLPNILFQPVHAGNSIDQTGIHKIDSMSVSSLPGNSPEASGLVWDPIAQTYWMVSDESSSLFELNSKGEIIQEIEISGLKIDDAESISIDNNSLYIAASVSFSKSGEIKNKRKKLVQLKREKKHWVYHRELNLYDILKFLAQSQKIDVETRAYLVGALKDASIDIEAHQVIDDVLYLGFKTPLNGIGQSVILKVDGLDSLFAGTPGHAEIWKSFLLVAENNKSIMTISDMLFLKNKIYLTGVDTFNGNSNSGLWEIDDNANQAVHLHSFAGYKAEGIAINKITGEAIIVFDGGRKTGSYFTHILVY